MSASEDAIGEAMVAWGGACRLVTRGRVTGRPRAVVVGFVPEDDGSLLVSAGSPDAAWARNLHDDPACLVTIAERTFRAVAEPLPADGHARAVRELILRYGTPSEALGRGPSFRLRPEEQGPEQGAGR